MTRTTRRTSDMEYISRKITFNIKFQIFLFLLCFLGMIVIYSKYGLEIEEILVFSGLFILLIANVFVNMAYRVGWDGRYLAYRDWGLKSFFGNKEFRVDAMDMTSLQGKYDGDTPMKRAFYEFDYINVQAKGLKGKRIWLHPMSLDELRLKLVLNEIYRLRPDIFSQNIIEYIGSDRNM